MEPIFLSKQSLLSASVSVRTLFMQRYILIYKLLCLILQLLYFKSKIIKIKNLLLLDFGKFLQFLKKISDEIILRDSLVALTG